jgi:hypothetical protein
LLQYNEPGLEQDVMFTISGTEHESLQPTTKTSMASSALHFLLGTASAALSGAAVTSGSVEHQLLLQAPNSRDKKQWIDVISQACVQGDDRRKSFKPSK